MYSTSELDELFQILNSVKGFKLNNHKGATQHSALKHYTKPNTKVKIQRQKVPDDEDIDIDKILKGDKSKMIEKVPLKLKGSLEKKRPKD